MMVGLGHIRPTVLRGLALALGVGFVAVALGIRLLRDWQPGESALVLLVPFGMGAYLLLSGLMLQPDALRKAIFLLLVIVGPGLTFATWAGCELQIFPASICGAGQ